VSTRRLLPLAGFFLMVLGGLTILMAVISASGKEERPDSVSFVAEPTVVPAEPSPAVEAPSPTPPPSQAPIERLVIPRAAIDAPVVVLGVKPDGEMQSPSTPTDVGWYRFTSSPGFGGNAVFSGHVDFANHGRAVFWSLRDLREGDEVGVRLADGTYYAYRVVSSQSFSSNEAPVQEIIGPTENEVVTLITCDGSFNTRTRQYDKRLIVRAERVREPAALAH
jgi:LPXTG-site transpeptidase (sortase) family protein